MHLDSSASLVSSLIHLPSSDSARGILKNGEPEFDALVLLWTLVKT